MGGLARAGERADRDGVARAQAGSHPPLRGSSRGNHARAGKRKSGRTTKGNPWLRATLVPAAWAASHSKNTDRAAPYHRLAARRGQQRALVAVAHSLLVILDYLLKRPTGAYRELGPLYVEQLDAKHVTQHLVRRLERLGHKVTLEKRAATAPVAAGGADPPSSGGDGSVPDRKARWLS